MPIITGTLRFWNDSEEPVPVTAPIGLEVVREVRVERVLASPDEIDQRLGHGETDDEIKETGAPSEEFHGQGGFPGGRARIPLMNVRIEDLRSVTHPAQP